MQNVKLTYLFVLFQVISIENKLNSTKAESLSRRLANQLSPFDRSIPGSSSAGDAVVRPSSTDPSTRCRNVTSPPTLKWRTIAEQVRRGRGESRSGSTIGRRMAAPNGKSADFDSDAWKRDARYYYLVNGTGKRDGENYEKKEIEDENDDDDDDDDEDEDDDDEDEDLDDDDDDYDLNFLGSNEKPGKTISKTEANGKEDIEYDGNHEDGKEKGEEEEEEEDDEDDEDDDDDDDDFDDYDVDGGDKDVIDEEGGEDTPQLKNLFKHKLKMKDVMFLLLLAYKLKFVALIPLFLKALILLGGATTMAGFFFALFSAAIGLQSKSSH